MSYKRVTILTGAPVTDEVIELTKSKYMPAVRAMGAIDCEVVQTGPDSTLLIATYADKAAADAAADKAAAMRAEGQEDFKGDVPTVLEGEVIVTMTQPNNKVGTGGVDDGPTMPSGVVG